MISVAEARTRILSAFAPLGGETVALAAAHGRTLAVDVHARLTQPPLPVSAMDGYAVRAADIAKAPASLTMIGTAPAGHMFAGTVGPGQCVRIFTGAVVPEGADTILIQENADADGTRIVARQAEPVGRFVRPAGLDFKTGDLAIPAGTTLDARHVGLAAATNHAWLDVRRRPRVAILSTGDEIVLPGTEPGPGKIVSSNGPALAAFVAQAGGDPVLLPIAPDDERALQAIAAGARGCDLLVTTGGASVGDHDLVRQALGSTGLRLDFWQIAMRPGKPLMFGRFGDVPMIGLPGNPVSSLVCAVLFVGPAIAAMLGRAETGPKTERAALGRDLEPNDRREEYMRATLSRDAEGTLRATPFAKQDSSMIALLARAEALAIRPANAPAAKAGDPVDIIRL
ncbi:MAG: molybdopterin molybdotransferase MoeA [Rhodospirillales bacterium]|nr:molybdopterin molybdotransferase MoeA [Rhodospirillales bacterium]